MGIKTQQADGHAKRNTFAQIPSRMQGDVRKLRLHVEEKSGITFVSSPDFPEIFIALEDRAHILPALDETMRDLLGDDQHTVTVFMNCQRGGSMIDAIVEVLHK